MQLRMYSSLNMRAVKEKVEDCLVAYHITRHLNRAWNKTLLNQVTEEVAVQNISEHMEVSRRTAHKILRKGNEIFWNLTTTNDGVKLVRFIAQEKILRHYGIFTGYTVWLESNDMKKKGDRRTILEDSFLARPNGEAVVISRATRKKLSGRSKSTQIRGEKKVGTKKTPVIIAIDGEDTRAIQQAINTRRVATKGKKGFVGQYWADVNGDGRDEFISQKGNEYSSVVEEVYTLPKHLRGDPDTDMGTIRSLSSSRQMFSDYGQAKKAKENGVDAMWKLPNTSFDTGHTTVKDVSIYMKVKSSWC